MARVNLLFFSLTHNSLPTSLKFHGVNNIPRTINALRLNSGLRILADSRKILASFPALSRLFLILLIIAGFGMSLARGQNDSGQKPMSKNSREEAVLGDSTKLREEIDRTKKILTLRPDYLDAWIKLSILYEQLGDLQSSLEAKSEAISLNPNLFY